jgi:hypothetical protein
MHVMRRLLPVAACLALVTLALAWAPASVEAHVGLRPDVLERATSSAPPAPDAPVAAASAPSDPASPADPPDDLAWTAAPVQPAVPSAIVLLAALAVLAGARRPRQGFALALVLILACFAFETGVHSVHHLDEQRPLTQCAVAFASHHVSGTEVDVVMVDRTPAEVGATPLTGLPAAATSRPLSPHEGRAPPQLA